MAIAIRFAPSVILEEASFLHILAERQMRTNRALPITRSGFWLAPEFLGEKIPE
jgi:hypothetical protein